MEALDDTGVQREEENKKGRLTEVNVQKQE